LQWLRANLVVIVGARIDSQWLGEPNNELIELIIIDARSCLQTMQVAIDVRLGHSRQGRMEECPVRLRVVASRLDEPGLIEESGEQRGREPEKR
jgi:hypothetical protein